MDWIRRNIMAIIVLGAVILSFVVGMTEAESARDSARADNIDICILGNERGALTAAYQHRTADARRASGDIAVANDYDAFARGAEENLAIAKYIDHPEDAAQARLVETDEGPVYRLTGTSKELIAQGCERALGD